jgi:hypothetical protein
VEVVVTALQPLRRSLLVLTLLTGTLPATAGLPVTPQRPQDLVAAMIENENAAAQRHERYEYLSNEKSDRTGGHLWTERVVETAPGRLRLRLAVDGKPLSPDELQAERSRLQAIHDHPESFVKHELNTRTEEKRIRQVMDGLPHNYIFESIVLENGQWKMNFRPDPSYTPGHLEERVLHNMAGRLVIDAKDLRLVHMDFHLVQDVSIGFGLLADIHTGSNFETDRQQVDGRWHTLHVATVVRAKAMLFKSVDLNLNLYRSEFQPLDHDLSVQEAVELLLRNPGPVPAASK